MTPNEDNRNVRAHVYVSGRVQGVFFRESTRQKAEELGLAGWVANLPDGRVEAVFEGDEDATREMLEWCRTGPEFAKVEGVGSENEEAAGDLHGFEVR